MEDQEENEGEPLSQDAGQEYQRRWSQIIERRETQYQDYWYRGDAIVRRYEDERESNEAYRRRGSREEARRYNILWSNTETLKPVLYSKVPDPVVSRRWADNSPVARMAAEVLQRCTEYNRDRDNVMFDDHMRAGVFNYLVPGTFQLWVRYAPEMQVGPMGPQKGDETVHVDYVHWRDFLCTKANVWSQVWWVCRKRWWSRGEVVARWGPDVANDLEPQKKDGEEEEARKSPRKYLIYEIWDKKRREVVFFSRDADRILQVTPDPLRLEAFFPCPKPALPCWTTGDTLPIPLYWEYQDQAAELDDATRRIYVLLDACKVVGVYDQEMGADFQKMFEGSTNKLIPVQNWNEFAQKGGLNGTVVWLPLREVVAMLQQLMQTREQVKRDLAEITGITDIVRGVSSPMDAEGTNQLKVQWGSMRIRTHQREVQRIARDALALTAEIIAEHFSVENLQGMSGIRLQTQQEKQMIQAQLQAEQAAAQQAAVIAQQMGQPAPPAPQPDQDVLDKLQEPALEDVVGMLRSEKLRGFALDIETDSTIEADDAQEREDRAEFINALASLIERFAPLVAQAPEMIGPVKETIMFGIRPFRAGRQLEDVWERAFDQMEQRAKMMAQQPQPDPMEKAITADLQKTQMQEAGDTQRTAMQEQGDTQRKLMDIAADREAREAETVVKLASEAMKQ